MTYLLAKLQVLISRRKDKSQPLISDNDSLRKRILERVFNGDPKPLEKPFDLNQCGPYLSYYNEQYRAAVEGQEMHWLDRDHTDILKTISLVDDGSRSRDAVMALLEDDPQVLMPHNALERTLELSVRLLSMHGLLHWHRPQNRDTSAPIRQQVLQAFPPPEYTDDLVFERQFDARALERVAGFEITWTDDLSEHLSLHDRGDCVTVWIYHHAAFLTAMQKRPRNTILPDKLAEETLKTLALLFPPGDRKLEAWFLRHAVKGHRHLDPTLLRCDKLLAKQRTSKEFHFWRDRLIVLKQEFDATEPRTIYHWWHDRRRRVQWATFWVAALVLTLTIFFGLVQSIEGALQVYKAFVPTNASSD